MPQTESSLRSARHAKKYEIARLGQSPIFKEDYPLALEGYLSPPDFTKVVTKLNRIRAKTECKKKYSETLMTTLLLTGTILLFPLFPMTMLFTRKEKEISRNIEKYLQKVNAEFSEQGLEFVLVCPYESSMIKKVYIVIYDSANNQRVRFPGASLM